MATTKKSSCYPRRYDHKWQHELRIPLLIQFSGSTKSANVHSRRLLWFRILCAMYCLAIMIWSFVRYAYRDIAEFWMMYLTVWIGLLLTCYFVTSSILHIILMRYISDHNVNLNDYFQSDSTGQHKHSRLVFTFS